MIIKPNIFQRILGAVRFLVFILWAIIFGIVMLFVPNGTRAGVIGLKVFMRGLLFCGGIKLKVHGKIPSARPLLIIGNHISVFEMASFPAAFGNSFFSKDDVRKWPFIGWISAKFGVIFINRNSSAAITELAKVRDEMKRVSWPMVIYPEGTTTNGFYVKKFKSALFNFIEPQLHTQHSTLNTVIQPVVMAYRHRDGSKIEPQELADNYSYIDNKKQDCGPLCVKERGLVAQVFHVFALGGFMVEIYVLPTPDLTGIKDRKELAAHLHKIISEKYEEIK
jgi:1-acyl-sn-glycerol-3-phosphate acyltransferase